MTVLYVLGLRGIGPLCSSDLVGGVLVCPRVERLVLEREREEMDWVRERVMEVDEGI